MIERDPRLLPKVRPAILAMCIAGLAGCAGVRPYTTALLGEARVNATELPAGALGVPGDPGLRGYYRGDGPAVPPSGVVRDVVDEWASRDLPDWQDEGKVTAPRVMLAKLATGRDIQEVNEYILAAEPWAGTGSTYALRKSGDYDFSLPPLTAILYLYGEKPELLHPGTRDHLLGVLLNQDGDAFVTTVPGSLGLVQETENHILMNEGSRYLKNQWLRDHGDTNPLYDNEANGLEEKLVSFIRELESAGLYEFNSNPYAGYTLMALLTLDAFAAEPVASAARSLIDQINYEFVLSGLKLRRYVPYRRQTSRAGVTDLADHPHTSMMRIWVAMGTGIEYPVDTHTHQAVYAALMPYRLTGEHLALAISGARDYYVRIGRGPRSSPEIYSAGDGYLLAAGGTGRRGRSQIVARRVTLLLDNGAGDAGDLFAIGAEGRYSDWNNTGVLPGVAVGAGPVIVPPGLRPAASAGIWSVYRDEGTGVIIVAGSTSSEAGEGVGLLYVLDAAAATSLGMDTGELAEWFDAACTTEMLDSGTASLPDGRSFEFDLRAPADDWVITSIDGRDADRDMTAWPRLDGWLQ